MNDGGPAFPSNQKVVGGSETIGFVISHGGMSLRDWFAGMALSSICAAPDYSSGPCNAAMAERAYVIADEMLKARGQ